MLRNRTITAEVEVDLVDAIGGLTDEERKQLLLEIGADGSVGDTLYVTRAYEELVAGRRASALAYLESYLFPALHITEARRAAQQKRAA